MLAARRDSFVTIETSNFHYNSAAKEGGVLYSYTNAITMDSSNFTKNRSPVGAVIYAGDHSKLQFQNYLLFDANSAEDYGVIHLVDSQLNGDNSSNIIMSNNLGSLVAFNSSITFNGCARFVNNIRRLIANNGFKQGTAVTLLRKSNVTFNGVCNTEIQILPSIYLFGPLVFSLTLLLPLV